MKKKKETWEEKAKKNWLFRLCAYPIMLLIVIIIYIVFGIFKVCKEAYDIVYTNKYG